MTTNTDTCLADFCPNFNSGKFLIGEGRTGEVFSSVKCPNVALKISRDTSCSDFKKQFDLQKKFAVCYQNLINKMKEKKLGGVGLSKRTCVLTPTKFEEYNYDEKTVKCSFRMRRIFDFEVVGQVVHTMMDEETMNQKIKGRGIYYGQKELKKLLKNNQNSDKKRSIDEKMYQLAYDIGVLIAVLNIICETTHTDVEFIIGKVNKNSKYYKLYVIDFDQVKKHNYIIDDDFLWAFESEPYAPLTPKNKYNQSFWDGYFMVAKLYGRMKFAKKVKNKIDESFEFLGD